MINTLMAQPRAGGTTSVGRASGIRDTAQSVRQSYAVTLQRASFDADMPRIPHRCGFATANDAVDAQLGSDTSRLVNRLPRRRPMRPVNAVPRMRRRTAVEQTAASLSGRSKRAPADASVGRPGGTPGAERHWNFCDWPSPATVINTASAVFPARLRMWRATRWHGAASA